MGKLLSREDAAKLEEIRKRVAEVNRETTTRMDELEKKVTDATLKLESLEKSAGDQDQVVAHSDVALQFAKYHDDVEEARIELRRARYDLAVYKQAAKMDSSEYEKMQHSLHEIASHLVAGAYPKCAALAQQYREIDTEYSEGIIEANRVMQELNSASGYALNNFDKIEGANSLHHALPFGNI